MRTQAKEPEPFLADLASQFIPQIGNEAAHQGQHQDQGDSTGHGMRSPFLCIVASLL